VFWNDKEKEELRLLWSTHPIIEIADKLRRTFGSIERMAYTLGLKSKERINNWTDDKTAQAIDMRLHGESSAVIGKKLHMSRNSVISRLNRLGIPRQLTGGGKRVGAGRPKQLKVVKLLIPKPVKQAPRTTLDPPQGDGVALLDRRRCECGWMTSHQRCCGEKTFNKSSWCEYHYARVFRRKEAA